MSKTKVEIINETVEFYQTHPRSIAHNSCLYRGPDGTRCAFSRCMLPEYVGKVDEYQAASRVLAEYGQECLQEEYRGHSGLFWDVVQRIHDGPANWNGMELTKMGRENVEYDIKRFSDS